MRSISLPSISRASFLLPSTSSSSSAVCPSITTCISSRSSISSSPTFSSPFLLLTRSYERLSRRPPPRRSHAFFQQQAEQKRLHPTSLDPHTSASITAAAQQPQPPLTVFHKQYQNPFFLQVQQLEQQSKLKKYQQQPNKQITLTPISPITTPTSPTSPLIFAVFELNGAQYKVVEDDLIMSHRLSVDIGNELVMSNVLLMGSLEWSIIGRPVVPGAVVHAVVEEHARTDKILVFHKKRRKNHRKMRGYRDDVTVLRITKIVAPEVKQDISAHGSASP